MSEPERGPATSMLMSIADRWASGSAELALVLRAAGELDNVDVMGTMLRSQFMLGAQVGLSLAAIDPKAGIDIRNQIIAEMAAVGQEKGIPPGDETTNVVNRIATMVIDAYRETA